MKIFSFRPKKINITSLYEFFNKVQTFKDGYLIAIKQDDNKTFDMVHINHLKGKMFESSYAYCKCGLEGIENVIIR